MLNNTMVLVGARARRQLDVDLDVVGWNLVALVVAGWCCFICGGVNAHQEGNFGETMYP